MFVSHLVPDAAPLAVRLLGGLQVRRLGETLSRPFLHRKTASLFAYLLLHPGRTYLRSYLASTIWPEEDEEEKLLGRLRNSLVDVRRLLEPLAEDVGTLLVSARSTLHLRLPPGCWVDVWEFEAATDRSTTVARGSGEWFAALEQAARLYQGPLLPDFSEEWCLLLREDLQRRAIRGLHELIRAETERKQYAHAAEWAQRVAGIDATDEESHRALMELYAQMGERARALRQYQVLRGALGEIGAAPDERTLALYQRIVSQRPRRVPPREPVPPEPVLHGPLVGRDRELRLLRRAWDRARSGRGELALLVGEAGIGKSRLGRELLDEIAASGGLSLYGQAYPSETRYLYLPLLDPMRRALQLTEQQGLRPCSTVWMRQVARLLPELAQGNGAMAPPDAESPGLLEGLTQFFLALAAQRPVTLYLDDLQWADAATGQFLQFFSRRMASARLLLLGAYREGEISDNAWLTSWVTELAAQRLALSLPLRGLDTGEVLRLLQALAEDQASERLLRPLGKRLCEATQGNPLFVREQLRALFEEGWLALTEEGRWQIASELLTELVSEAPGPRAEAVPLLRRLPLPRTIQRLVEQRVARLPEPDRELLACAAMIGRRFNLETLRRVTRWKLDALLSGVERLMEAEFFQAQTEPAALDFRHDMVRDVVYQSVAPPRRLELHRRVGEALETLYGAAESLSLERDSLPPISLSPSDQARATANAAEMAWHFREAAPLIGPQKAILYSTLAGRRAVALCAYERAVSDLKSALSMLSELSWEEGRLAQGEVIVSELSRAYRGLGQHAAACELLEYYVDLCRRHHYPLGVARGSTLLGHHLFFSPGPVGTPTSREMYERAIAICQAHGLSDWIVYPRSHLAYDMVHFGVELDRVRALLDGCLPAAERHRDANLLQRLHTTAMFLAVQQRDWEAFRRAFEASLAWGGPQVYPVKLMMEQIEEFCWPSNAEFFADLCRDLAAGYARAGLRPVMRQWYLAPDSPCTTTDPPWLREGFESLRRHPALQWQDPTGRSQLDGTSRRGWLGIRPPGGSNLWPLTNLNAPRLMATVEGSFVAETKCELGDESNVFAGLLLWYDEQEFVRLELRSRREGGPTGRASTSVKMEASVAGDFQTIGQGRCEPRPWWLRLERTDGLVRGLCSADGTTWLTAGTMELPRHPQEMVGVAAVCEALPAWAWFDHLVIWRSE